MDHLMLYGLNDPASDFYAILIVRTRPDAEPISNLFQIRNIERHGFDFYFDSYNINRSRGLAHLRQADISPQRFHDMLMATQRQFVGHHIQLENYLAVAIHEHFRIRSLRAFIATREGYWQLRISLPVGPRYAIMPADEPHSYTMRAI